MNHGGGDEREDTLSAAAREAVGRARRRARQVPTPDDIAGLTIAAGGTGDLTRAQIRRLAAEAIASLQEVNFLLGRLVELVGEERDP